MDCERGNEKGTSAQFFWTHLCPKPTVGRPIGSGAGEGTKPSKDLIRLIVAAFGPVAPFAH